MTNEEVENRRIIDDLWVVFSKNEYSDYKFDISDTGIIEVGTGVKKVEYRLVRVR